MMEELSPAAAAAADDSGHDMRELLLLRLERQGSLTGSSQQSGTMIHKHICQATQYNVTYIIKFS